MKIKTLFLLILLALIAIFVAINWNEFTSQTTISLLFGKIEAPLGLIMLGLLILLALLFLVYALYLRSSAFISERHISKDLKDARVLAENAELSRFTELKQMIEEGFKKLAAADSEQLNTLITKLDKLQNNITAALNESRKNL